MTTLPELTLRQGLAIFYRENKGHLSHEHEGVTEEVTEFFNSHDVAHVIFGCDISLFGEGAVKIWTIFGTTLGLRGHLRGYKQANAFELSKRFDLRAGAGNLFKLLLAIPTIITRAKRMPKPWPWAAFEPYLDTPISELRKEFNIKVL